MTDTDYDPADWVRCPVCHGACGPVFCRPCNGRGLMDATEAEDWQDQLDECARDADYYEQQDDV